MNENYRPTTESTFEQRLYFLIEECGEVLQAAGKLCRFGPNSGDPRVPPATRISNAHQLSRELNDLRYAANLVSRALSEITAKPKTVKCSVFTPVDDEKPPVKTILLLRDKSGDIYWGDAVYGHDSEVPVFRIFSEEGAPTYLAEDMSLVITHWLTKAYNPEKTQEFLSADGG